MLQYNIMVYNVKKYINFITFEISSLEYCGGKNGMEAVCIIRNTLSLF